MKPHSLPQFDNSTLLQIACTDFDVQRAHEAWDVLAHRFRGSEEMLQWIDGSPHERLLPLLGQRAEELGLDSLLQERCTLETSIAWGLNVRLFAALNPVLEQLNSLGIHPIALKGLGLIGDVYPHHWLRHVGDADLMIEPQQVRPTVRVLRELGWEIPSWTSQRYFFGQHAVPASYPTGARIDLHVRPARTMPRWQGLRHFSIEAVPREHPLSTSGLQRLTNEIHAVVLCCHISSPVNAHIVHSFVDLYRLWISAELEVDTNRYSSLIDTACSVHADHRTGLVLSRMEEAFGIDIVGARALPTSISRPEQRILNSESWVDYRTSRDVEFRWTPISYFQAQWYNASIMSAGRGLPTQALRTIVLVLAKIKTLRMRKGAADSLKRPHEKADS